MKTAIPCFFLIMFLLLNSSFFAACNNAKENTTTVTTATNRNTLTDAPVDQALAAYYQLSDAFVNWDTTAIQARATTLKERLKKVQNDSSVQQRNNSTLVLLVQKTEFIAREKDITQQRRAFDNLSQEFYTWLNQNNYSSSTVYLQECPMAFNDEEKGQWLSKSEDIRNPYLGLHHPKYKKGMLECGIVKDSIQRRL